MQRINQNTHVVSATAIDQRQRRFEILQWTKCHEFKCDTDAAASGGLSKLRQVGSCARHILVVDNRLHETELEFRSGGDNGLDVICRY